MKLPDFFVAKLRSDFPDEAENYFESLKQPPLHGLRANTLKISPDALLKLLGIKLEKVSWCDSGFYYSAGWRPAKSPFYHAGLFYIQEPSAMSAAAVFDVAPGDKVLDICAAPGGKTSQLAAKLNGTGIIAANDSSNTRCRALLKNMELLGITNSVVLNETPERLAAKFPLYFDKILIDAPCSGEGMFRKDPCAVTNYTRFKSNQMSAAQKHILRCADKMLKPGGGIMYSTCTFAPEENEEVIGGFLTENPQYSLAGIGGGYGFDRGGGEFCAYKELDLCARLWPHKIKGEGHFLARLKKQDGEICLKRETPYQPGECHKNGMKYFKKFCGENLLIDYKAADISSHGDSLYAVPEGLPDMKGLRIIRTGLYLGDIKKDRFEPSQALAMSLKKEQFVRSVDFSPQDSGLYKYLRGESHILDFAGNPPREGYCLVCVSGYPLGFAKAQKDGALKNKYLKSWVMS